MNTQMNDVNSAVDDAFDTDGVNVVDDANANAIEDVNAKANANANANANKHPSIAFSILTSENTLTKTISLNADGALNKQEGAKLYKGKIQCGHVAGAADFARVLKGLDHKQALIYGVPKGVEGFTADIYSKSEYEKRGRPEGAITRTREAIEWPRGGGVMMLDYDPPEDGEPLTREGLLEVLTAIVPQIANCAYVCWYSSSSFIYNTETGEQITGARGQRIYLMVKDAKDIERAGKVLHKRLWLAGHGYFAISKSGQALERSLFDVSVWQPERLDYAAGAKTSTPLEQRRCEPFVHEGPLLDTELVIPDLTKTVEEKAYANKTKEARQEIAGELEWAREGFAKEYANAVVERAQREAKGELEKTTRKKILGLTQSAS